MRRRSPHVRGDAARLGRQLCLDKWDDLVWLRVATEHRFREHERAIDVHVEDAVRARYDLDRDDVVLVLFEQSSHQTGGLRPRPSGDAVLDPNQVVGHPAILTGSRRTRARLRGRLAGIDRKPSERIQRDRGWLGSVEFVRVDGPSANQLV